MSVTSRRLPDRSSVAAERTVPPPGSPPVYRLADPAGVPLGTIAAPAGRPVVGSAAPTIYLRRSL